MSLKMSAQNFSVKHIGSDSQCGINDIGGTVKIVFRVYETVWASILSCRGTPEPDKQ